MKLTLKDGNMHQDIMFVESDGKVLLVNSKGKLMATLSIQNSVDTDDFFLSFIAADKASLVDKGTVFVPMSY